ncbi:MAG TPA: Gfo/Idh/MocA family oxidoreductase [Abditibacteriaceae bacterium]|nr:Gfo/Idh/MocA family oxidoreductase [Abditibacteriaceae bacterium]
MIKLALIGCGSIAQSHAARFTKNAARLKVVATVDLDEACARHAAQAVGAAQAVTDFREVLGEVDAVLIAVPHNLHHAVGLECLEAGKHVLMEKPLANSERECLDLIEASEKHGAILMTAYCMRYHPLVIGLKEAIEVKTYGDTFHVSIWTEQYTKRGDASAWHHRIATLGGGQLFSHGCHYIDILLWYLGNPVAGTHTGTNCGTAWMEREGTSDVSLKFESGAVGYHGGTWGARGTRLGYAFHAHGTEGLLEADFRRGQLFGIRGDKETVLLQTDGDDKNLENEMAHFLDCIEKNRKPLTDGPSSLQGLRVIWRLYEAEEKRAVADLRGLGLEQPWR